MSTFWDITRQIMKQQERGHTWLARQIGVSPHTIKSWEYNDRIPRADHALKIAEALEENIFYLVTGNEQVKREYLDDPDVAIINEMLRHVDRDTIRVIKELLVSRATQRTD